MASPGTVYLLRNGDSDVYKIGRTRTTAKRRRGGLSTGNPERLTTVKEWAVPARHGEFEQLLHCTFADRRLRSGDSTEFFDFAGVPVHELVAQIDREHASFAEGSGSTVADAPQRSTSSSSRPTTSPSSCTGGTASAAASSCCKRSARGRRAAQGRDSGRGRCPARRARPPSGHVAHRHHPPLRCAPLSGRAPRPARRVLVRDHVSPF